VNVHPQSHWKSKYLNANYCFKCCKEKDLTTLPKIVKRLIKIQKNYFTFEMEKHTIIENDDECLQNMSFMHRENNELGMDTLRQRVCFLQIQNTIQNKEELMTWNKIISNQLLQTDGYVEFYEIDKIKSFFANNMPLFCDISLSRYSRGLDDALDQMSCMQI
jgi:hypothetical protein